MQRFLPGLTVTAVVLLVCGGAAFAQTTEDLVTVRCYDEGLKDVVQAIAQFGLPKIEFAKDVRDQDVTVLLSEVTPAVALQFVLDKYGLEKVEADGGLTIRNKAGATNKRAEGTTERKGKSVLAGDDSEIVYRVAPLQIAQGGGLVGGGTSSRRGGAAGGRSGGLGLGAGGGTGLGAGGQGGLASEEETEDYLYEVIEAKHIGGYSAAMLFGGGYVLMNTDVMQMGGSSGGYGGGGYGGYGGGGYGGGGYGGGGYGGGGYGGNSYGGNSNWGGGNSSRRGGGNSWGGNRGGGGWGGGW